MRKIIVAAIFIGCLINSNRTVLVFAESNVDQLQIEGQPLELIGENKKAVELTLAEKELTNKLLHVDKVFGEGNNIENTKKAIQEINTVINDNPELPNAYFTRALIRLKTKEYDKAIADINSVIKLSYQELFTDYLPFSYSIRAKAYKELGNYKKALDDLESAININPKMDQVLLTSGSTPDEVDENKMWQKKDLTEFISILPSDYRGYLFRGCFYSYFAINDEKAYQLAIKDYEEALRLNPKSALCNYLLAMLYLEKTESFWLKMAGDDISDQTIKEYNEKAIQYLDRVIVLNSKHVDAYIDKAQVYRYLKQYNLAIKNYNKAIELDPNHAGAYHDRGIVKFELGDNFGAIMDYDREIEMKEEKTKEMDIILYNNYKNRSDANMKVGNWDAVIRDLTKMIKFNISNSIVLMHSTQFRALYPEYDSISDEELTKMLWLKYNPYLTYEYFEGSFLNKSNKNDYPLSFSELYITRGNAYLNKGDYRKAIIDYTRAIKGFPNYAETIDRWRLFSKSEDSSNYIDILTVENVFSDTVRLWMKIIKNDPKKTDKVAYILEQLEIDIPSKMINQLEYISYDANGKVLEQSNIPSKGKIVPDTIGEVLYNGFREDK